MLAAADLQLVERYLAEFRRLSEETRQELANRFMRELRTPAGETSEMEPSRKTLLDFAGLWANDPDADTIEEAIRTARVSRDKPELDHWD